MFELDVGGSDAFSLNVAEQLLHVAHVGFHGVRREVTLQLQVSLVGARHVLFLFCHQCAFV